MRTEIRCGKLFFYPTRLNMSIFFFIRVIGQPQKFFHEHPDQKKWVLFILAGEMRGKLIKI